MQEFLTYHIYSNRGTRWCKDQILRGASFKKIKELTIIGAVHEEDLKSRATESKT